jgi:two-component system NarL family response regulator
MAAQTLKVFLVEDHELTRRGLVEILTDDGLKVVGEAASAAVARSLAPRLDFDVAVVDVHLKDGDGVELAAALRELKPGAAVVMLSSSSTPQDVFRALRGGAVGYLTKDMSTDRLAETLRAACRGEAPLSREMTALLVRELQRVHQVRGQRARTVRAQLTMREWQILTFLAEGKRTGEIAADLVISVETVRSHIKSVMRKLGVHTRAAAVACIDEMRDTMEPAHGLDGLPLSA